MQVYKGLDNITNKHPIEERENIPHHLLGHVGWDEEYSVQQFEKEALAVIDDIHSRGKLPILVGGTHYYNQAVMFRNATLSTTPTAMNDLDGPSKNQKTTAELTDEQKETLDGPTHVVLEKLKEIDPIVAEKFHPNDSRRIRRALEIFYTTSQKPSEIYAEQAQSKPSITSSGSDQEIEEHKPDNDGTLALRFRTMVFWIWCEQSTLNPRLDGRVDTMLEHGLYDEINELYSVYQRNPTSNEEEDLRKGVWQVIGFKEFLPWLRLPENEREALTDDKTNNTNKAITECIDKMKQRTRKYSKQQTKFMKNTLMPKLNAMVDNQPSRNDVVAAILDATDLSQWGTNVAETGVQIAKDFLSENKNQEKFIASSAELQKLLVTPKSFTKTQWKHYPCSVCVDSQTGQPFVAVGEDQWAVHLKSRKHKSAVSGKAKYEHNLAQMALRKARNDGEPNATKEINID